MKKKKGKTKMFKDYKKMFIFDTETSALSPGVYGEILELGGILLSKPDNSDRFSERKDISVLIKNKYPITNSHIHHITDDMCAKDGIEKQDLFNLLKPIFGDYDDILIVAYNAPFDMQFVEAFMQQIDEDYVISNPVLDVLEVAKQRTGLKKGNKLCDMIVRYSVENVENSHRALDDVEATLGVMRAMWKEKPDLERYIRRH